MQKNQMDLQLKEAGQLTGAAWAAWLERPNEGGFLGTYKINSKQRGNLLKFLKQPGISKVLKDAIGEKEFRSRTIPKKSGLLGKKLFIFPNPSSQQLILVAGEGLSRDARRIWVRVSLQGSMSSDDEIHHQESEPVERNLNLIHEVVEQVIGKTDVRIVAQTAAELIARHYECDLSIVALIRGPKKELQLAGIGGKGIDEIQDELNFMDLLRENRLALRVARTGKSALSKHVANETAILQDSEWNPGSEMCVALKEGEQSFGIIEVVSKQTNVFSKSDLQVLESLGGIIASVISNVGQYQKLQMTVKHLRSTQEELQGHIAAQQMAERRLVQAAKLVAVGEMAAGIAHELNNPLTTVAGFTELTMEEVPADSRVHADLELVLREARRASEVVRRLLDFARQSDSVRTRSDINEIVREVLALVNHLLHTSGVQLITSLPNEIPAVSVDNNQIKQVLLNLIHNALHAMTKGGELRITTERRSRDHQDWVAVIISDTGIGISPENLERIFEPFFTTRAKEGGTGLGLSISYGIIAEHGGFIEAESRLGKGSIFSVWIPVEVN